jgi:hypothetical protein
MVEGMVIEWKTSIFALPSGHGLIYLSSFYVISEIHNQFSLLELMMAFLV